MIDEQKEQQALARLRAQGNPMDYEKPAVPAGELLCNGCWKVSGWDKGGWISFSFKTLANQTLCPECAIKFGHDLELKQRMGL